MFRVVVRVVVSEGCVGLVVCGLCLGLTLLSGLWLDLGRHYPIGQVESCILSPFSKLSYFIRGPEENLTV